jgi:rhodanese-related sulfurtransferase
MCGRPNTTIGFERLYNPLTHLDRQPFIASLTDSVPARPLNMTVIEGTNRGVLDIEWAMLTSTPHIEELDVDELEGVANQTYILDVREPGEYAYGHIPGAVNVPQADIAARLNEIPRDRELVVVCQAGYRSLRAAQFLKQMGYEQLRSLAGGTDAWITAGKTIAYGDRTVDHTQVVETEWAHAGGTRGSS